MLYANIKILSSEKQEFKNDEGKDVQYFVNVIKTDDGDVLTINSGKDYSENDGETGMGVFRVTQEEKRFKLTLADFHRGTSVDAPEKNIE